MPGTAGVTASKPTNGKLTLTINVRTYGVTGLHWKEQLSGSNRDKWGKIYISGDAELTKMNRSIATGHAKGLFKGYPVDIDECPGAMFMWDGPEQQAHDVATDRSSNRALGSAIRHALRSAIDGPMAWYQVEFEFVG